MIQIDTRDFGTVEVEEDAIYEFPDGVYGFEEDTRFAVFSRPFEDISFLYLQSAQNIVPCFLVFEPQGFHPDYRPLMSEEDLASCGTDCIDDLIFLVIATVHEKAEELSINIKSPVVLNPKTRKARQVILQNPDYPVRYLPFQDGKAGS
ncbi:MAG TPA: flagellar assembly protein FliW [Anaerovoracaceae bacterium]|nr:flagellar assembly protein FliW [Anaerovoracaceae bacterium]